MSTPESTPESTPDTNTTPPYTSDWRVWIDTASGTWGDVGHLRVVDLDDPKLHDADTDTFSLIAFLEGADDGEISDFGRQYGSPVTRTT